MARARRSTATRIADVAERAAVSSATVSRVMNDRFLGAPEIAERVRLAAEALGYSPSPVARSLALGTTKTTAFVVPDLANPAFQNVLSRLTKAASKDDVRVLVADSGESPEEEALLAVETRRRCDSIVLCAPRMPADVLERLAPSLEPLVLINRPADGLGVSSISVDYAAGVTDLARHLAGLGHRHLVYVEGPPTSASNAARRDALQAFAAAEGVRLDRIAAGSRSADGHRVADAVLETGATAALAFNDLVAVGLLTGLGERGVPVPDRLSVTGFDDIDLARYVRPALTTATVPWEELGGTAWERLQAAMDGAPAPEPLVLAPRMIVRGSTGPAA